MIERGSSTVSYAQYSYEHALSSDLRIVKCLYNFTSFWRHMFAFFDSVLFYLFFFSKYKVNFYRFETMIKPKTPDYIKSEPYNFNVTSIQGFGAGQVWIVSKVWIRIYNPLVQIGFIDVRQIYFLLFLANTNFSKKNIESEMTNCVVCIVVGSV